MDHSNLTKNTLSLREHMLRISMNNWRPLSRDEAAALHPDEDVDAIMAPAAPRHDDAGRTNVRVADGRTEIIQDGELVATLPWETDDANQIAAALHGVTGGIALVERAIDARTKS